MIDVFLVGNRWTWRMICAAGRTLVYPEETWATDFEAFAAAKAYRSTFWRIADVIDHRMARCI